MKKYTGTKTVKAMPMTMGEAYKRGLLKRGVVPSESETDKPGYLVEYEGGYLSWSPAEPFDKAYRPDETFLDRLIIEHDELKQRYDNLEKFLSTDFETIIKKVGNKQASLLHLQGSYMSNYLTVLETRLAEILQEKIKTSPTKEDK